MLTPASRSNSARRGEAEARTRAGNEGRVVLTHRLSGAAEHIACPSGILGWSIRDAEEQLSRGKVLVR